MLDNFDLSADGLRKEEELLTECRKAQGEYLQPPNGGWATTYSNEFVKAAAGLYRLYKTAVETNLPAMLGYPKGAKLRADPHDAILRHMAKRFQEANIRSCRRSRMTVENVIYRYDHHLAASIRST